MSGTGVFKVIRIYDPAIDFGSISYEKSLEFLQTRDPDLLDGHFIDGEKPTVFHCAPLTLSERRDVRGRAEADQFERAFSLSIRRIENWRGLDGKESREWIRPNDASSMKVRPLNDKVLEQFSERDVQHVGQVVLTKSFLAPDTPVYVRLLDTCRDALTAAEVEYRRRHVAQMSDSSPSAESKASQGEPPAETR